MDNLEQLSTKELQERLRSQGLPIYYKVKTDLIRRLRTASSRDLDKEESTAEVSADEEFFNASSEKIGTEKGKKDLIMANQFVFRDVEESLEIFDGENTRDVDLWIKDFKDIAEVCSWNEIQKYLYARRLLRGAAKLAVEAADNVKRWSELEDYLVREFGGKCTSLDVHRTLEKRKKKVDETYLEYMFSMKQIASKGSIDERSLVTYIVDGLVDSVSNKAMLYDAKNFDELKGKIKVYERVGEKRNKENRSKSKQSSANGAVSVKTTADENRTEGFESLRRTGAISVQEGSVMEITEDVKRENTRNKVYELVEEFKPVTPEKSCSDMKIEDRNPVYKKPRCLTPGDDRNHSRQNDEHKSKKPRCFECDEFGHISRNCSKRRDDCTSSVVNFVTPEKAEEALELRQDKQKLQISMLSVDYKQIQQRLQKLEGEYRQETEKVLSLQSHLEQEQSEKNSLLSELSLQRSEVAHLKARESQLVKEVNQLRDAKRRHEEEIIKIKNAHNVDILQMKELQNQLEAEQYFSRLYKTQSKELRKENAEKTRAIQEMEEEIASLKHQVQVAVARADAEAITRTIAEETVADSEKESIRLQQEVTQEREKYNQLGLKFQDLQSQLREESLVTTKLQMEIDCKTTEIEQLNETASLSSADNDPDDQDSIFKGWLSVQSKQNIRRHGWFEKERRLKFIEEVDKCSLEEDLSLEKEEKERKAKEEAKERRLEMVEQLRRGEKQREKKGTRAQEVRSRPRTRKGNLWTTYEEFREGVKTKVKVALGIIKASKEGYGAILFQRHEDQNLHPVSYLSYKSTDAEKNYSSYELEILAVVKSLKRLRTYLLGLQFKIYTDCKAFELTMAKKDISTRIARWALLLGEFDCTVHHRPGVGMKHVDALSRHPAVYVTEDGVMKQVSKAQQEDERCKLIANILREKEYDNFLLRHGVLYKFVDGDYLLVIPKSMQRSLIRSIHEKGHYNKQKTETMIRREYFISSLEKKVEEVISSCVPCILAARKAGKQEGFLNPIDKMDIPLHTYHIDHLGPLPSTSKQYKYLFVVTDAFTKFAWIYPVKTTTSEEVIKKLELQSEVFGHPHRIISDRGPAFTSGAFEEYCKEKNINHVLITTGVPRGNGQVERLNQTIINVLSRISVENPQKWFQFVPKLQMIINSSNNRAIGKSPFEVLIGTKMKRPEDVELAKQLELEMVEAFEETRNALRDEAKKQLAEILEENKRVYNKRRKPSHKYTLRDLVAIRRTQFMPGSKLLPKFLGPYEVTKINKNDRYEVKKVGFHDGPITTTTSADYMKPWATMEDSSSETDSEQDGRMWDSN